MRTLLAFVALILSVIVALTFGAENDLVVPLNYFFAKGEFKLSSLLVTFFFAGFLLALLMSGITMGRLQLQVRKLRKQLAKSSLVSDVDKDANP